MRQIQRGIVLILLMLINNICLVSGQTSDSYITEVTQYGVKEGLSHRAVVDLHQDSRGFIWLATQYGLNRYDGKEFQWFTREKQGLPSNYTRKIYEDNEGWLWVMIDDDTKSWLDFPTTKYIIVINIYTLEIKTIEEHLPEPLPFAITDIRKIDFLKDGTVLFMAFNDAFYKYDKKNGFKEVKSPTLLRFIITENNTLLGLTNENTYKEISLTGDKIREHQFPDKIRYSSLSIENQIIENIKYNNEYLIFVRSENPNGLFVTSKIGAPSIIKLPDGMEIMKKTYRENIFYDKKRKWFWYKGLYGVKIFSLDKGEVYDFSERYPNFSKSEIYDIIFSDKITWVATSEGLFKIKLIPNPFINYFKIDEEDYSLNSGYSCRGMIQIGDALYVNVTNGKGPHVIDLKTAQFTKINYKVEQVANVNILYPKSFFQDKDNNLWLGSYNIFKQNLETQEITTYTRKVPVLNYVWSIFQDKKGTMWFGGDRGIGFLNESADTVTKITLSPIYEELNNLAVYQFLEISPTEVLLATVNGIFVFNPLDRKIVNRYWSKGKGNNYFLASNIHHIHRDNDGIFWVVTGGDGLIRWERTSTGNTYEQFTVADGLSNNILYAVYEDKEQNLWIPSDYGIIKFNKITHNCRAYLPEDGVNQEEFNRISHFQAKDGRLYFGGLNGITAFYPKDITDKIASSTVPLEIIELLQYSSKEGKIVNKTIEVIQSSVITLRPGDRFFDLKFALLNFDNTDLIRYAYRIEGIDNDWNYIKENNVRISGLPYGNHTLQIKGQSANGQFSTQQILLKVRVIRPIYLRWWFVIMTIIGIVTGIYYWYQLRTRQLKENQIRLEKEVSKRTKKIESQAEELKNLDKLKSRFFANISHELRTPLTLMLAPIDAALKRNQLKNQDFTFLQIAKQNGKQLLKLINDILDLTKLDANNLELNTKSVLLFPFVRRIVSTFESYAQNNGINLSFNYQAEETLRLELDKRKFEVILNNLLSNAIKFTPSGGRVTILITDNSNHILIQVKDTGRGIHPNDLPFVFDRYYQTKQPNAAAEGGTGIGLALVYELVTLFGGTVEVESELGQGTVFTISIPRIEMFDTLTPISEEEVEIPNGNYDFEENEMQLSDSILTTDKRQILIVEDNPTLRNFIKTLLSHHHIQTAGNGQEALEAISKNRPDLIISDVMMPIMDGFQLLERLKSAETLRQIPILMLTARASMGDKLKALRIGVDDYMTKPFEQDELYARVNNLLKNLNERSKWEAEFTPQLESAVIEAEQPSILSAEQEWLETVESVVDEHFSDPNFNTTSFAEALAMSRSQLFRKIKKLTGLSPSQYLQETRLTKAYELFESGTYDSVKAVAFSVGITHQSSFSSQFKERFGKSPSDLL